MDAFRPGFAVLRALRDACKPELPRLVVIMILGFPKALWPFTRIDSAIFRYLVAIMALFLLTSLLLGLR